MTKMIFIQKIENVDRWLALANERRQALAVFATDIAFYLDADAADQVALSMDVHDLDGMRAFSRSSLGASLMQRGGNVEQVDYFTHLP